MEFPLKRSSVKENFPFPADGAIVEETPPTLIWVPVPEAKTYTVQVKNDRGETVLEATTENHFFYDRKKWDPGCYTWDVLADTGLRRGSQHFNISPQAVYFRRPDAKTVFDSVPGIRPRHLFMKSDIPEILAAHQTDLEILRRNVEMAYAHGFPEPPRYHIDPQALPYREYFGLHRDYCDRDLVACALLYGLTGDKVAGEHGKNLLLTICGWDPDCPCSLTGEWGGDEVGLSNARCLPGAFDLLYDLLNEEQIKLVAAAISAYARQCEYQLQRINYVRNPSNSHAGRLPAYLGEAALVLKGTGAEADATLLSWLEQALEIYCGIFPFYGGPDGSWAEGAFYCTSYTKWYLPFFRAVERFSGFSLFDRPFYMRLSQYLLHFCDPRYEIHPFGDGYWCKAEDQEWPGFFAQNPYRVYAERFGPELAKQRMQVCAQTDYFRLHLLDIFLPKREKMEENPLTGEAENAALFSDGGFAVMHTDMQAEDDICVMMRASRFSADSHRHADQGSFALFCGGKALISPSGYFGRRYGTEHHVNWTRSTQAHNAALINGCGQISGVDAGCEILSFEKESRRCVMDLGRAYPLKCQYIREITLDEGGITVTDRIEAEQPVSVTYPLHTLAEPSATDTGFTLERENCRLTVTALEGLELERISDQFGVDLNEGEPEQYHVTMPTQYHVYLKAGPKCRHTLRVRYAVYGHRSRSAGV